MEEYQIVLFKNKNKKKVIKKYYSKKRAVEKYNELIKNNDIKFETKYENSIETRYELGLLCKNCLEKNELFSIDEFGRNVFVESSDKSITFLKISDYLIEETIQDYQTKNKIKFDDLFGTYLSDKTFKNLFTLNNKFFIQEDESINCFILKNESDSIRLLNTVEYFLTEKNYGFISMTYKNTIDKKYIYNILENYGFDRKFLYRKNINHPRKN